MHSMVIILLLVFQIYFPSNFCSQLILFNHEDNILDWNNIIVAILTAVESPVNNIPMNF